MSDMSEGLQPAPEILAEAKADGWADKDSWRGSPDLWVDATEFVRRKHTVLPLLRQANGQLNTRLAATEAELTSIKMNMGEFVKYQQEQTIARLADQRKALLAEKRAADEAGDDARVVAIEEQLDENSEARAEAKVAAKAEPAPTQGLPPPPPELTAWQTANPWFGTDDVKTGLAMGLGREAAKMQLSGAAYFAHIDKGIAKVFAAPPPAEGKSEGGGPSGSALPAGGVGKYSSLPADARAQCDADAKRFVGKGKLFETTEAWRENFVKLYSEA